MIRIQPRQTKTEFSHTKQKKQDIAQREKLPLWGAFSEMRAKKTDYKMIDSDKARLVVNQSILWTMGGTLGISDKELPSSSLTGTRWYCEYSEESSIIPSKNTQR